MGRLRLLCLVLLGLVFLPGAAARASVPGGFNQTLVAGGLSDPTLMALAPDGRLFVSEEGGSLRVIENGALLPTPFVHLNVDPTGERGLLGVAFDPNFASNHFVYVYYTVPGSPAHNRVSRFTASGDVAVAGSETPILDLNDLSYTYHNGGSIHFGPDGRLYVAVGDDHTGSNAQSLSNLFGKMLRINPDGSIPTDNPFYYNADGQNRAIWAVGLRNPYTFAFQPGTGRMFINDVGENTWEEIDDGIAGSDYGWPLYEGPGAPTPPYRGPTFYYGHGSGGTLGCAITGGAFYNPTTVQFPADYVGDYFFADYCNGWIRRFDPATGNVYDFASGINGPVDLVVGNDGSLYVLARLDGAVYRITAATTAVLVRRFAAVRGRHGVTLNWRSGSDPRLLGFEVYREDGGRRRRLNAALIVPSATRHASSFTDRSPGRATRYWLEAVLLDGARSWFGPAVPR